MPTRRWMQDADIADYILRDWLMHKKNENTKLIWETIWECRYYPDTGEQIFVALQETEQNKSN